MKTRIKICGVRRSEDVLTCIDLGVDYVGFNFHPASKRYVSAEDAAPLVELLPYDMQAVGVFVNAKPEDVVATCTRAGIRIAQLHGDEDVRAYAGLPVTLLPVLKVAKNASLEMLPPPNGKWVLMDAKVEGFGGQGQSFDWSLVRTAKRRWQIPILLAGGLTPENVGHAVEIGEPWGVDVASGIEQAPGIKDPDKIKAFVAAVRAAED